MRGKVSRYSLLLGCLLLSGCSIESAVSQALPEVVLWEQTITSCIEDKEEQIRTQLIEFFSNYLTIDEATILALNQRPKQIDDHYWAAYRTYKTKTNEILGDYLSNHAKDKLEKQYLQDDFHYPRFLDINDYMMVGISKVEGLEIVSKERQDDYQRYDLVVTVRAKVISSQEALERYRWDESLGYYTLNLGHKDQEAREDQIKVSLNYMVEILDGEPFKLKAVREKPGIYLGIDEQASPKNNFFMARLPYTDQVEDRHREKVHQFLEGFMKEEYNFYSYYRKAYHTNYEMMKLVLENDLKLKGVITLKEDYKPQFSPLIIPLKDDMDGITFDVLEDVRIKPHISSSLATPAYEVKVNTQATLLDGGIKNYEYIYQFTFENDMILSVRFINQLER